MSRKIWISEPLTLLQQMQLDENARFIKSVPKYGYRQFLKDF